VLAWVAMAPTPASTWGTRLPTAGRAVETQTPKVRVFEHLPTMEKVAWYIMREAPSTRCCPLETFKRMFYNLIGITQG
jgi:hypothetical protein